MPQAQWETTKKITCRILENPTTCRKTRVTFSKVIYIHFDPRKWRKCHQVYDWLRVIEKKNMQLTENIKGMIQILCMIFIN